MLARCRYYMWLGWRRIVHRPILSILLLLIIIYFGSALVVMVYEDVDFLNANMEILPAFFGEIGIIESPFVAVQISIIVGMIASVTVIVIITAKITSVFVEFVRRGGIMAKKVNLSGHTIICGWNFQGELIVKELLSAEVRQKRGVVILTDSEERPLKDERVEFIKGDPSQDEDLIRAGIMKADSVIVLTDLTKGANEADAEALMVVLAVESLNREVHTCVQIVNSANRMHLERAHADEIICLDQVGGSLAVASALNHGVSRIVSELLNFDLGSEFYRYDGYISERLVGKEFAEAVQLLAQQHIILLAVETGYSEELLQQLSADVLYKLPEEDRVMVVNPQSRYEIRQGDALFVIAESQPTRL
jgi:voltage-gated potassium channel